MRMVDPVKKLLGGAVVVLSAGGGLADHVHWWLRYQMDGSVREDSDGEAPD
jgi:hypothetical protein